MGTPPNHFMPNVSNPFFVTDSVDYAKTILSCTNATKRVQGEELKLSCFTRSVFWKTSGGTTDTCEWHCGGAWTESRTPMSFPLPHNEPPSWTQLDRRQGASNGLCRGVYMWRDGFISPRSGCGDLPSVPCPQKLEHRQIVRR